MNRLAVALLAALDAVIAVAIGLGVCVVPILVLWVAQYGMDGDPVALWQAGADIWMLGHGVELTVSFPAALAVSLGVPASLGGFPLTMTLAGFSLLTLLFGARIGSRAARAGHPGLGAVVAVVVTAAAASVVAASAGSAVATPTAWQAVVAPTAVMAAGIGVGVAFTAATRRRGASARGAAATTGRVRARYAALDARVRDGLAAALRGGAAALLLLTAASALVFCLTLVVHFGSVIGLYESLQAGALGGVVLTLAQLAVIPNAVVWTMSWLVGPGFAIGAGTSVGPAGTQLGAVPAFPLLGAVPHGSMVFGFVGVLVPIAAGVGAGLLLRWRTVAPAGADRGPVWIAGTAAGVGAIAGFLVGLLAWRTSGAIGPGSLQHVGADALVVGSVAALEIAVGAAVGLSLHSRMRGVIGRLAGKTADETTDMTADETADDTSLI